MRTFRRLVAEHQDRTLRVCRCVAGDERLGCDAARETFRRLWNRLASGRAPARPAEWLTRTAVATALARARDEDKPTGATPDVTHCVAELAHSLDRALRRLPPGRRTVFLLVHHAGLSVAEVARALDVDRATARTQFARACLGLRARLPRFEPGPTP